MGYHELKCLIIVPPYVIIYLSVGVDTICVWLWERMLAGGRHVLTGRYTSHVYKNNRARSVIDLWTHEIFD